MQHPWTAPPSKNPHLHVFWLANSTCNLVSSPFWLSCIPHHFWFIKGNTCNFTEASWMLYVFSVISRDLVQKGHGSQVCSIWHLYPTPVLSQISHFYPFIKDCHPPKGGLFYLPSMLSRTLGAGHILWIYWGLWDGKGCLSPIIKATDGLVIYGAALTLSSKSPSQ